MLGVAFESAQLIVRALPLVLVFAVVDPRISDVSERLQELVWIGNRSVRGYVQVLGCEAAHFPLPDCAG